MIYCEFDSTTLPNGMLYLKCKHCGRSFKNKGPLPRPLVCRKLTGAKNKAQGAKIGYVLVGKDNYKIPGTKIILKPWKIYKINNTLIEKVEVPYEKVEEDSSKVGTRLKGYFEKIGYKESGCSCRSLGKLLDGLPISIIKKYRTRIAELISESAAKMNVKVSPTIIGAPLGLAIWQESAKLRKSSTKN